MNHYLEEGFFLNKKPYGENGALVCFFTKNRGKIYSFCHASHSKKTNVKSLFPLDKVDLVLRKNPAEKPPSILNLSLIETYAKTPQQTMGNLLLSELFSELLIDQPYSDFYPFFGEILSRNEKAWYLKICWKWIEMEGVMPDFLTHLTGDFWDMKTNLSSPFETEHTLPMEAKKMLGDFVLKNDSNAGTKKLLENTLTYLQTHFSAYKKPKSLAIINQIY